MRAIPQYFAKAMIFTFIIFTAIGITSTALVQEIYSIKTFQSNAILQISTDVNLNGEWIAEWDAKTYVLKDKVKIQQSGDMIIAEYIEEPAYPNCDGSPILPHSLYFEGTIMSDSKIVGKSWACQQQQQQLQQNGKKTMIPLELEIQEDGNKLVGVWMDPKGSENSFTFTKVESSPTSAILP